MSGRCSGAVGGHGGGRDRPHAQAPLQPALDQLGHGLGLAAAVLAGGDLGQQLGLDLLGLLHGGPALAGDLAADPALAAGERVTAGVDLDLEAVAVLALSDHGGTLCWSCRSDSEKNDQGMTAEQARQAL